MNNLIEVGYFSDVPGNFTGIAKDSFKAKYWLKDGKLHREDGPAVEYINGEKEWYKNGKLHREDGPAVDNNKRKAWFLNDLFLSKKQHKIIMMFSKESREKLYKNDNRGLKNLLSIYE